MKEDVCFFVGEQAFFYGIECSGQGRNCFETLYEFMHLIKRQGEKLRCDRLTILFTSATNIMDSSLIIHGAGSSQNIKKI